MPGPWKPTRLYQNRISGLACLIAGIGFALASLVQLTDPSAPRWLYLLLALFGAYFVAFRLGRGGIVVAENGIVVRNPCRTSPLIPVSEVSRCVLDSWHGLPDVAFLELKDGRRIPVAMLEISPLFQVGKDSSVHDAIEKFNSWVTHEQGRVNWKLRQRN